MHARILSDRPLIIRDRSLGRKLYSESFHRIMFLQLHGESYLGNVMHWAARGGYDKVLNFLTCEDHDRLDVNLRDEV